MTFHIARVAADQTFPLRTQVLRDGDETAQVHYESDDLPAAVHMAARDGSGAVAAVATAYPEPSPYAPAAASPYQLRFMAVDPAQQGRDLGRQVLEATLGELRAAGCDLVWANSRDSALGFYERCGFTPVEGSGFLHPEVPIPHTVITLSLA